MKNLRNKYLLFSILLTGILNGCSMFTGSSANTQNAIIPGDFIAYENASYGIKINYPGDWYIAEEKKDLMCLFSLKINIQKIM
ncbi:MAG: hypothetical protein ABII25_05460 [bacterium]